MWGFTDKKEDGTMGWCYREKGLAIKGNSSPPAYLLAGGAGMQQEAGKGRRESPVSIR